MHITSSTNLSDSLNTLRDLDQKIGHASFIPQEELFGMLVAGTLVIDAIIKTTDKTMFTQDEIDFIVNLNDKIGEELVELHGGEYEEHE